MQFAGWLSPREGQEGERRHPPPVVAVLQWGEVGRFSGTYAVEVLLPNRECLPLGVQEGTVSHRHARLFWQRDRLYVQDLGSKNGTRLNGQPIPSAGRGREGEPVPIPEEEAELALGRLILSIRIATADAPTVPIDHWGNFLSTTSGRDLSALFTRRIPSTAPEPIRGAALVQHLMDIISQHPNMHPANIAMCFKVAYPDVPDIAEMFQWLQAARLSPEHIAALKDPALILRLVEAKLPAVKELLQRVPEEELRSWERLDSILRDILERHAPEGG